MAEPTTNGQVEVDYEALPIGLGLGVNMAAGALVSTSAVLNYPSLSPIHETQTHCRTRHALPFHDSSPS